MSVREESQPQGEAKEAIPPARSGGDFACLQRSVSRLPALLAGRRAFVEMHLARPARYISLLDPNQLAARNSSSGSADRESRQFLAHLCCRLARQHICATFCATVTELVHRRRIAQAAPVQAYHAFLRQSSSPA